MFGHARPLYIADVLRSLEKQKSLQFVHVWLDGHQGNPELKLRTEAVADVVSNFSVARICQHSGNLGFRKMMLQALSDAVSNFEHIMVLEDDCFPGRDAVRTFMDELDSIENSPDIFSVYGHPFLVPAENATITRFQGWGWGTTRDKLMPFLDELIECYSLSEEAYLQFVASVMTPEIVARLDVTPPRLPTNTLRKFFAWDETLALLTALRGKVHKPTDHRTIFNFGAGADAGHFRNVDSYRQPPFNMITHAEVWDHY